MSTSDTKVRTRPANQPGIRHADDLYGWVQQQMLLLQAGEVEKVDASELLQELAEMGRSEFARLASSIRLVLHHLLKWDHQPERRSRSWVNTITDNREWIEFWLSDSPGFRPRIEEATRAAYRSARRAASKETGMPEQTFPENCPYSWEDILQRPIELD